MLWPQSKALAAGPTHLFPESELEHVALMSGTIAQTMTDTAQGLCVQCRAWCTTAVPFSFLAGSFLQIMKLVMGGG